MQKNAKYRQQSSNICARICQLYFITVVPHEMRVFVPVYRVMLHSICGVCVCACLHSLQCAKNHAADIRRNETVDVLQNWAGVQRDGEWCVCGCVLGGGFREYS